MRHLILALTMGSLSFSAANAQKAIVYPRSKTAVWVPLDLFPAEARQEKMQGLATVELLRDASGIIIGCSLVRSSGKPLLDSESCRLAVGSRIADERTGPIKVQFFWHIPDAEELPSFGGAAPVGVLSFISLYDYDWVLKGSGKTRARIDMMFTITDKGLATDCAGKSDIGNPEVAAKTCQILVKNARFLSAKSTTGPRAANGRMAYRLYLKR